MKTKRLITAISILFSAAALMTAYATQETESEAKPDVVKELAIMSKILDKRLSDEFAHEAYTANMFQRGVEGFHVPDVGIVFIIDVKFPVAEPPEPAKTEKSADPDDLWKQFERELDGGPAGSAKPTLPGGAGGYSAMGGGYGGVGGATGYGTFIYGGGPFGAGFPGQEKVSQSKIKELKSTIFDTLAKYGDRLEALEGDEKIIVIVNGGAQGNAVFQSITFPKVGATGSTSNRRVVTGTSVEGANVSMAIGTGGAAVAPVEAAPSNGIGENAEPSSTGTETERVEMTVANSGAGPVQVTKHFKNGKTVVTSTGSPFFSTNTWPHAAHRSVLIIQVAKGDLANDADDIEKQAEVHAYSY